MKGIYKITSPTGRIYIGQSTNIIKRWRAYRCSSRCITPIEKSIRKHGHASHLFEVIHEFPKDINQYILDEYEKLYIELYESCGVALLNAKEGGVSGRHSATTIAIIHSRRVGYRPTEATKRKTSETMKGRPAHNKGIKHSPEHIEKIRKASTGRKASPKMIAALIARNKARTGFAPWNKGREWSEEAKKKMSESHKGKKLSPESIVKRNISRYGHSKFQV